MTSVEFHQMAWELMANLWKHAGNVLLIFLLTLGADPACHHKYLAVEKTRDFVQLCLESDSKLILETLPGTLHIFGKQKIFRGSPVFIMHEIVMGGEKGVCDFHKRRGELELLLELNRLFLALALCSFPQEHGFLCEKRLFLNYLLFIYLLSHLLCLVQWEISYLWGQSMVLMGAEGREHAQSTAQCWETLLWWDRAHGHMDGTHGPFWQCSATLISLALLLLQVDDEAQSVLTAPFDPLSTWPGWNPRPKEFFP